MLISMLAAVVLSQAPSEQPAAQQRPQVQAVSTQAQPAASRGRRAEAVTCSNRAPTGSTLRRDICRTERRASAEQRASQDYLNQLTRGSANELLVP